MGPLGAKPQTTSQKNREEPMEYRTYQEIMADLRKPVPPSAISKRSQNGQTIRYLHWYVVAELLNHYAPGWEGNPERVEVLGGRVVCTYCLTIPAADGIFTQRATGQESDWDEETEEVNPNTGEIRPGKRVHRYGDPTSNAERMAFKRAAAQFGLGLDLYDKGGELKALRAALAPKPPVVAPHNDLAAAPDASAEWHKASDELWKVAADMGYDAGKVVRYVKKEFGVEATRDLTIAQMEVTANRLYTQQFSEKQLQWLKSADPSQT